MLALTQLLGFAPGYRDLNRGELDEAILGAVGHDFGMLDSTIDLAAASVSRAQISSTFRQGLLEFSADSERFWTSLGLWSAGTLSLVRCAEDDLSFLARDDLMRIFGIGGSSGDEDYIGPSALCRPAAGDGPRKNNFPFSHPIRTPSSAAPRSRNPRRAEAGFSREASSFRTHGPNATMSAFCHA